MNLPVHGDINPFWQGLYSSQREADIENGIIVPKTGWKQSTCQDDGLTRYTPEGLSRLRHGISPMGDQDHSFFALLDRFPNQVPVLKGHLQAVLTHQGQDMMGQCHMGQLQHLANLGLTHFVFALGIEVDLVDGPPGCDNKALLLHDSNMMAPGIQASRSSMPTMGKR